MVANRAFHFVVIGPAGSQTSYLDLMAFSGEAIRIHLTAYYHLASRRLIGFPGDNERVLSYLVNKRTLGDSHSFSEINEITTPFLALEVEAPIYILTGWSLLRFVSNISMR